MQDILYKNLVDLALHSGFKYDDNTVLTSLSMPLHVEDTEPAAEEEHVEQEDRLINGICATHDENRQGTAVDMEAFAECTERFLKTNHSLLYMHARDAVIGSVLQIKSLKKSASAQARVGHGFEFPYGGVFEGKTTLKVDDIWMQMQQDILNSFSLGMMCTEEEPTKKGGPIRLIPNDMLELTVCSVPANHRSQFAVAHAFASRGPGVDLMEIAASALGLTPTQEGVVEEQSVSDLEQVQAALHDLRETSQLERVRRELSQWAAKTQY